MGESEVDFVAIKDGVPSYFQVALSVLDPAVSKREFAPLRIIPDNYSKTVLTMDRVGNGDHDGIIQANLIDWLLES